MKIVIASDKFKGSLTSQQVNAVAEQAVRMRFPNARIVSLPMADGGDGFAAAIKHYLKTVTVPAIAQDPLGRKLRTAFEWEGKSRTAMVEMAVASGLALLRNDERNPMRTSSYGTGLLVRRAIQKGAKKIILGVGGSATNDGGMGLAVALGFRFLDKNGKQLKGRGESLLKLDRIEPPYQMPQVRFIIAADVTNPLCGTNGAAKVYGPQKGADALMVAALDKGLGRLADCIRDITGKDIRNIPGSGAAGGVAAILLGFFPTKIEAGISLLSRAAGLRSKLKNADLLITGEGRIDEQSTQGKLVGQLVSLANRESVPILLVCGQRVPALHLPVSLRGLPIVSLVSGTTTLKQAMLDPQRLLLAKLLKTLPRELR